MSKTQTFEIINSRHGHSLGYYDGVDEDAALRACLVDAGTAADDMDDALRDTVLDAVHVDRDAAVWAMHDGLREQLHRAIAPCPFAEFLNTYIGAHEARFNETFCW